MTSTAPESIHWRSVDGLLLHARSYAAQTPGKLPVICIGGLTRNARDFEDVAPWLASQGRRVIAVDLRGRGASAYDPRPSNYNPNVYARDIKSLLSSLGIARAHIVGTSLGGLVTMTMALRSIDVVAGAVLNDVGPQPGESGVKRITSYVGKQEPIASWDDARDYVARINGMAFPSYSDADWDRFARRTFKQTEGGIPALDYDPRISRRFPASTARLASMILWNAFKRLASQRPTLILRGEHSDILERDTLRRMRMLCPLTLQTIIPGVGHAPTLDECEARAALQSFFTLVD